MGVVYLSVIVPMYNEGDNVQPLYDRLKPPLDSLKREYEILLVDDGSNDGTVPRLLKLAESDPVVRVIELRRNFGQTAALQAGIDHARGEIIVTMDGDLQNDPADIPRLLEGIDQGYDLVTGWRRKRKDPWLNRTLPSKTANWIIARATRTGIHDFGCTLRAYRAELLREVRLYGEMHRLLPALLAALGARIQEIEVQHHPRLHGTSKYGLARIFKVVLDLMTVRFIGAFGTKPSYVFGTLGLLCLVAGFCTVGVLIYMKLVHGLYLIQSPLLHLSAMFVVLGAQFLMMGLLAEVMIRTYHESQGKKIYIIRDRK